MRELFSFLFLYIDDSHITADNFGVMFIMLQVNAVFFILDLYGLMKRKSGKETAAIMTVPGILSLMGATLLGLMIHVPKPGELEQFALVLQGNRLHAMLLLLVLLYGMLWAASLYFHKIYKKVHFRRFILSCILDYVCAAVILVCSVSVLIQGEKSFLFGFQRILWLFLHVVYLLGCKLILLAVGLIVRMYCTKLTFIRWHERKNASSFLFRYFVLYQNAMIRSILLFELGILIPFTILFIREGWNLQASGIMGFLYFCGIFVTIVNLSPSIKLLDQFGQWGPSHKIKEMFCREYFCEEAVFRNEYFTVTRHFLVDEQMPAAVYYWPMLYKISNWTQDKKGKSRLLWFSDKSSCRFSEEEVFSSAQVFQYAEKYLEGQKIALNEAEQKTPVARTGENTYDRLVKKMAYFLMAVMICAGMSVSLFSTRDGGKSGNTGVSFSERDPEIIEDFNTIYLVGYISYEYGKNGFSVNMPICRREYEPDHNNPKKFHESRNTHYTYDREGRLIYEKYIAVGDGGEDSVLSTTTYEYTEDGSVRTEISDYWDYKRISTKDVNGNEILYDEELGQYKIQSERSFNENDQLLLCTEFSGMQDRNNREFYQLRVEWDDTHFTRTVMAFKDPEGEPSQVWIDRYSEDGRRLDCGYRELIGLSQKNLPENLREYCYQAYWADYDAEGRLMECAGQGAGVSRNIKALLQYEDFSIYRYYAYSYNEQGMKEWEFSCSDDYLFLKHYLYDTEGRLAEEFKYKICTDDWEQTLSDGSILTFTRKDNIIQSIYRYAADGRLINELYFEEGEILLQHTAEGEILWKETK